PPLLTAVTSSQMSTGSSVIGVAAPARDSGVALHGASEMAPADTSAAGGSPNTAVDSAAGGDAMTGRDIITTAQVTLRVADVSKASDAIGDLAAAHNGYVEATDIGFAQGSSDTSPVGPREPGSGWISIRIPADEL